jgi:uncharacterized protein with HEPN domain
MEIKERDAITLNIIKEFCKDIQSTINRFGDDKNIFDSDLDYRNSIFMALLQIGENAKTLSNETKKIADNVIPWQLINGLRNRIAHGYGDLKFDIVWDTIHNDIPALQTFCETKGLP